MSQILSIILVIELFIGGKSLFTGKFAVGAKSVNGSIARWIGICNILPIFIWLLLIYFITQSFGVSPDADVKAIRMIISGVIALSFGVGSTMFLLRLNQTGNKEDNKDTAVHKQE